MFAGRVAVLATMHKKEQAIAPILEQELGIQVVVPKNFDTDVFGTFTREIDRPGNQLAAAKLKAEQALIFTGETLAIASEGTFGPHPDLPYIFCNREIVVLLDKANDLEIVGQEVSTETNFNHQLIQSVEEAYNFARKVGFPKHGLVIMLHPESKSKEDIFKEITTEEQLFQTVQLALQKSTTGKVHIETDMRALYNPTRMENIAKATKALVAKINQICPKCSCPGLEVFEKKRGLPCGLCNLPTTMIRSEIYKCKKCSFEQEALFPHGLKKADPAQCMYCNP